MKLYLEDSKVIDLELQNSKIEQKKATEKVKKLALFKEKTLENEQKRAEIIQKNEALQVEKQADTCRVCGESIQKRGVYDSRVNVCKVCFFNDEKVRNEVKIELGVKNGSKS